MDIATIYVLIIVFAATLMRSTFGFGQALIAVPLLALIIPIETAVPLSVLISTIIAAVIVVQDREHVHFNTTKWLVFFAILGIPFGLLVLLYGSAHLIKLGLGGLIILYSVYSLTGRRSLHLEKDNMFWLFVCGFFSGVLGGAYGVNGPPLIVYGNMRKWSAKQFRATLQGYFLPAGIFGMLGYWYKGLWSHLATYYFLISIPVIIPAIFLGRFLNHRLKDGTFFKYVYVGLTVIGLLLISQSFS